MLRTYRDVLSRPGAAAFSAAGVVARMPMAMVGIGIVLAVSTLYGSYGLAGRVSAAYVVAAAVCAPQVARLVDRHGQARVMRPFLAVAAVGLTILVVATATVAHPAWLYAGAVAIGAGAGSYGSLVRARWSHALGGDPRRLHTAYSLESALDELVFVVGPVVTTLLATSVRPEAGLVLPLLAVVGGGLWFLSQRATEPPPAPHDEPRPRGTVLRATGMPLLALVFVAMGSIFGATDVSTVAFATEQGARSAAGIVLAVFAAGSLISGLLYGARHWRTSLRRRFAVGIVALAAGVSTFLLVGSLPALAAAMFVIGFTISPTIITGNGLVQALVPGSRLTEGLAWVGTSLNIGVSVGSSVAGMQIDAHGSHGGFLVVLVSAGVVVVAALVALPQLRGVGAPVPVVVAAP